MRRSLLWALAFGLLLSLGSSVSAADQDDLEEEEDEGRVESDEPVAATEDKDAEPEDDLASTPESSPDAETVMVFTHPANNKELPAGKLVKFLVSLYNRGDKSFTVESLDASFRYPMDYSFYIQNYTAAKYNRKVAPLEEASFDYAFVPSESFAARPFGLTVLLHYKDSDGIAYRSAVFNETVQIIEDESGLNPETGFLYVVGACIVVLGLLLGQQMLSKMRRKAGMGPSKKAAAAPLELGTANANVNMEWIPNHHINIANKSPKASASPKSGKSPRQRRARREGNE